MEKNLFKKVIVGFAFSPNLRANVFESIRLAKNFNAKLFFIHVGEKTDKKEKTFNEIIKAPLSHQIILKFYGEMVIL